MRRILTVLCLIAAAAGTAEAARPVGPGPKPSWPVDRFGRTMVPYVDSATIDHPAVPPGAIGVTAQGHAMTGGWSDFVVSFADYGGQIPLSGIIEARLVGKAPGGMVTQAITYFTSQPSGFATSSTQGLRGFHVCAQNGCITIMTDGTIIGGSGVIMGTKTGKTQ
jgi:hypothetical protein